MVVIYLTWNKAVIGLTSKDPASLLIFHQPTSKGTEYFPLVLYPWEATSLWIPVTRMLRIQMPVTSKDLPRHMVKAFKILPWWLETLKSLPAMQETWVQSLSCEDPLEKGMATHSSILAWRIPWTEHPGRLQSMGSQRVGCNWVINTFSPSLTRPLLRTVSKLKAN